jgi:hypothetical protein
MSREGVMLAARERARRAQVALGEGAPVLMGYTLVALMATPRGVSPARPAAAANASPGDPAAVPEASPAGASRAR